MATLHLMAAVAAHEGFALHAVTVDHALRPESRAEAAAVAEVCAGLGVPHQTLRWDHGAVAGNLMDAARKARYDLMADWAAAQKISHILLGHTADDQAETFLMGLAREAGIDGLVGMRRSWQHGAVRFLRPFLVVSRADLRGFLTRQDIAWMDDPSNENDKFTRVKARRALQALKPLGITVDRLNAVTVHLREAQGAVMSATDQAAKQMCRADAGAVIFDRKLWQREGGEVQRRLLIAALRWISGAGYAPRGSGVFRVMMAIAQGKGATLAGCRIRVGADQFCVMREPKAVATVVSRPGTLWDGRWKLNGPFAPGHHIAALGAEGLRQCKDWRATGHSRDSLLVSPAVWYDDTLIAAPIAGHGADFSARIVAPFTDFILSH